MNKAVPISAKPSHTYQVKPNDTLSGIAAHTLGATHRWTEIAKINHIKDEHRLIIGQTLHLPEAPQISLSGNAPRYWIISSSNGKNAQDRHASIIPARTLFFVIADEINPLTRRVVRKVIIPPKGVVDPAVIARLVSPEKYGFTARDPGSPVSMGRHVGGRVDSKYISASDLPHGSPRFEGKPFWINVAKAQKGGTVIHETATIIRDLDRVIEKTLDPVRRTKLKEIREKAMRIDHEVLLEGHVPATAIKTGGMMALTRGGQVLTGVGIVMTAYDLEQATERSIDRHSIKPLAAESVRQIGGWSGALAGAELGGLYAAAAGIETGPGAIITGLIGAAIGGYVGYTHFSPAADIVESN